MYYLYILRSDQDGSYYIGYTSNLKKRLHEHNNFVGRYTSSKKPWQLVYVEEYTEKHRAIGREKQIKKMKSKKYISDLIGASRC